MYSALKVNGRKLYELAREGKEVERAARQVEIHSIRLLYRLNDRAGFHVSCSKGTYIRTLCEDIGERIGVPATMSFLLRTRVGPFEIGETATLEEIAENPQSVLLPADLAVSHFTACHFDELETRLLKQGQLVQASSGFVSQCKNPMVRLYSEEGVFFGIGQFSVETGLMKPSKIFAGGNEKHVID
jgi:tRNA pseudouridine55 synthase